MNAAETIFKSIGGQKFVSKAGVTKVSRAEDHVYFRYGRGSIFTVWVSENTEGLYNVSFKKFGSMYSNYFYDIPAEQLAETFENFTGIQL